MSASSVGRGQGGAAHQRSASVTRSSCGRSAPLPHAHRNPALKASLRHHRVKLRAEGFRQLHPAPYPSSQQQVYCARHLLSCGQYAASWQEDSLTVQNRPSCAPSQFVGPGTLDRLVTECNLHTRAGLAKVPHQMLLADQTLIFVLIADTRMHHDAKQRRV